MHTHSAIRYTTLLRKAYHTIKKPKSEHSVEISAKYWLSWSGLASLPPISMGWFLALALLLTCAHSSLTEPWATLVSLLLRIDGDTNVIDFACNLIGSLYFATSAESVNLKPVTITFVNFAVYGLTLIRQLPVPLLPLSFTPNLIAVISLL